MASFAYGSGREPVAVSLLDEKGVPAVTTRISRDAAWRPVAIDDGRVQKSVAYNRFGYPTEIKDVFGNVTKLCYNTFNVPVKVIDANGIVTEFEYNADGLVTSVTRKDGAETLASVSVAYDESARPVSVRDQDGRVTAFDRDAFGRVLKEKFADGSEVAYTYDAFGRRTSVLDENGHKIAFDWNRFGLSSRTTAENQLTDYVRDDDGLVTEILSKQNGRTDRAIKNEYDEFGRLVYVDYGKDGNEDFTWDGLALIQRGNEHFINEPHIGGGNPVVSSKGTSYFNDMLGTTVGAKPGKQYSAATLSAFGEDLNHHSPTPTSHFNFFFTGKPEVAGLGHAFLMRNYRAGLGKWQTADPLGYPDGWNQLKYGVNSPGEGLDMLGCSWWPFGDDIEYTLIGQNIGVDVPIPGYSGTTLYCKGGATKIQITVPGQQCSVSIKFSPDLTGLTNMSVELLERVMSVLKGAPVSLTFEIKPTTISVDITQFVCSAHKHTDVTIHRGMADVRVYMQRYFDVYLGKNKKTGEATIKIVDNGSWKSDVVYTELKKCE